MSKCLALAACPGPLSNGKCNHCKSHEIVRIKALHVHVDHSKSSHHERGQKCGQNAKTVRKTCGQKRGQLLRQFVLPLYLCFCNALSIFFQRVGKAVFRQHPRRTQGALMGHKARGSCTRRSSTINIRNLIQVEQRCRRQTRRNVCE